MLTITTTKELAAVISDLYDSSMPVVGDTALVLRKKGGRHFVAVEAMVEGCGGLPAYTALLGQVTAADFDPELSSINPANLALILAFLQAMAPLLINKPAA